MTRAPDSPAPDSPVPDSPAHGVPLERVTASAYRIPTETEESDGTLSWSSTTLVVAEVSAGGERGLGYTYGHAATAKLIADKLAEVLQGTNALATAAAWRAMMQALRNEGGSGIAAMAVAAVDAALWDLRGRLLDVAVVTLLGQAREEVPAYGSGGFTSYEDAELERQLSGWVEEGLDQVKMKVGRDPTHDLQRVALARNAIGKAAGLMVDANGAYPRKRALAFAEDMAALAVTWFEEPVSSEDIEGLRLLRDRAPAPMEIAAGEYGYDSRYFRRLLERGAVDVLQADASRCAGITGFMTVDALCQAFEVPLSAHCAPALHCHPCCAAQKIRHVEAFHDHRRIEEMLFDGAPVPRRGRLAPDLSRPGLGLELKRADAAKFAI